MITLHYWLIKKIISAIIFPLDNFIIKYFIHALIFKDDLNMLQIDLSHIKDNLKNNLVNKETTNVLEKKINKLRIISTTLEKMKTNKMSLALNWNKYDFLDDLNLFMTEFKNDDNKKLEKNKCKEMSDIIDNIIRKIQSNTGILNFFKLNRKSILHYFKQRLINTYGELSEKLIIDTDFEAVLLKPSTKCNNIVIFCNPNGMSLELCTLSDQFINFYHKMNISILLWNYQGYGERGGCSTFNNIKFDGEKLFKYILKNKSKLGQYAKIGVHGTSMGGLVACHLANKFKDDISFLVCDRNFSSVDNIISTYYLGSFLSIMYTLFYPQYLYSSDNVFNYSQINSNKCVKVILSDCNDEIIPNAASLKESVTIYFIENFVKKEMGVRNQNSIIKHLFTNFEVVEIIESLSNLAKNLDKMSDYYKGFFKNVFLINFNSPDVVNNSINYYIDAIDKFLNNLFVWGYYSHETYEWMLNESKLEDCNYKSILTILGKIINELKSYDHDDKYVKNIIKFFSKINVTYYKLFFEQLEFYSDSQIEEANYDCDDIMDHLKVKKEIKINYLNYIGYFLNLTCGHNGFYNKKEQEILKNIIKSSY